MKKIIICILPLILFGCGSNPTKTPTIAYHVQTNPLDLSKYRDFNITSDGNNICMSYEEYAKHIELINIMKDYIVYQRQEINSIDEYYNPKKK